MGEYIDRVTRGKTFGGKVAAGISVLPTWMLEFAMTGGLANIGKESTKQGMILLLNKYAKTKTGQVALRAAGWVGGAITRTTVGLPSRVQEKAFERQLQATIGLIEQEGWATSFAKAWGDVVIESASEESGEFITKIGGKALRATGFGSKIADGLQKAWTSITGGSASKFNQLIAKGGYSNILGEIGEERLGTILRAITNVDDFGAGEDANVLQRLVAGLEQDIKSLPVEVVVLSLPLAGQSIVNRFVNGEPVDEFKPKEDIPLVSEAVPAAKAETVSIKVLAKPVKVIKPITVEKPKIIKPSKKQAVIDATKFLKQVKEHEDLVKGEQGIVDVEPIEFDIEKERQEGLSSQWYESNREVYKKTVLQKSGEVAKAVGLGIEKVITPISTRLFNINPKLFRATRRQTFNVMTRTTEQVKKVETFLKETKSIPKKELAELDLAFKNSDGAKISEILSENNLNKSFKEVRAVLDKLFEQGKKVGLNIDYRRNYMPRVIKDAKGFLDFVRGTDDWPIMEEAIKRQEKARNRPLTDEERAVIANTMLRGYRTSALTIASPGATKTRTVPIVDAKLNQFYLNFKDSLVSYIQVMNESIATREFFGRETKSITKTRGL